MQIGVDTFGAVISDPATGLTVSAIQRTDNLLDEIVPDNFHFDSSAHHSAMSSLA
jgi:hypothetical protein